MEGMLRSVVSEASECLASGIPSLNDGDAESHSMLARVFVTRVRPW